MQNHEPIWFNKDEKKTNNFKYTEILSLERERYAGVTKVNAFFDGFKILVGMFKLKLNI